MPIVQPENHGSSIELRNRFEVLRSDVSLDSREDQVLESPQGIYVLKDSDGPLVQGIVNDEAVSVFLDTGAAHNIIEFSSFERIRQKNNMTAEAESIRLKGVTGNPIKVLGKVWLNIEVDNCMIQDYLIITQGTGFPGDVN